MCVGGEEEDQIYMGENALFSCGMKKKSCAGVLVIVMVRFGVRVDVSVVRVK